MKYGILIIVLIVLILVSGIFVMVNKKKSEQTSPANKTYQTQVDDKGAVVVEVTPISLIADSQAVFEITLSTHSVSLDYDLTKISQISDDKGSTYEPLSWSGGSGGHHLSGTLTFPRLLNQPRSVKLLLRDIDNKEREFTWQLK